MIYLSIHRVQDRLFGIAGETVEDCSARRTLSDDCLSLHALVPNFPILPHSFLQTQHLPTSPISLPGYLYLPMGLHLRWALLGEGGLHCLSCIEFSSKRLLTTNPETNDRLLTASKLDYPSNRTHHPWHRVPKLPSLVSPFFFPFDTGEGEGWLD